jgi:hypothetical protein
MATLPLRACLRQGLFHFVRATRSSKWGADIQTAGGAYGPTPFVGMYAPFGIGSRRHAKERHVCATRGRAGQMLESISLFYERHKLCLAKVSLFIAEDLFV